MQRKRWDGDRVDKFLQTSHAGQLDRLLQGTVRPQRAVGNADVDLIFHLASTTNALRFEVGNEAIFFAFQVQPFRRNLFQMNFHSAVAAIF